MALTKTHADLIAAAETARRALDNLETELAKVARAPRSNARKLTEDEVANIRYYAAGKRMNQREIADAFDVNPATVSRIVRGQYHRG